MRGTRILFVTAAVVAFAAVAEVKPLEGPWLGKGETLVCFGDSITAAKNGYASLLTEALAAKGVKVVNAGRSGDKTPMALTRLADVVAQKPDKIPVAAEQIDRYCRECGIRQVPVRFEHALKTCELERIHADPFDRMLGEGGGILSSSSTTANLYEG